MMDIPPLVDVFHSQPLTGCPRKGFIPPPLGAQSENGGPNSSFALPSATAPAWPSEPLLWNLPRDSFSTSSPAPQPSNWPLYPTHPTPYPPWTECTSSLITMSPNPGGRAGEESTWGQPIAASPWGNGIGSNYPGEWPVFGRSTDSCGKGWSAHTPRGEGRRKTWGSCTVRDGDNGTKRPEIPCQTYRRSWSPAISYSSYRSRSPSPVPGSLPYNQPPPSSAAPYCRENPENFLSFNDYRTYAYVANDPFVPSMAQSIINISSTSGPTVMQSQVLFPVHTEAQIQRRGQSSPHVPISRYIVAFLFDTVPRQIYLYSLLTLPSLYFSRVASIFEQAGMTMPDIKKMAIASANEKAGACASDPWAYPAPPIDSRSVHLKESWERFTDSLVLEWTVLSLVSVFLFPAILIILQIDGALKDPYIRYPAFLALVCSLMSVSYGCLYIVRFDAICGVHNIAEWAEKAQKAKTPIWWNVWVLLALPSVWFSWSIMFYTTCVMTLVWRTGTDSDVPAQITSLVALDPRIVVTIVFTLGLVYLCLIIREIRRGDKTGKGRRRVLESADAWKD